MSTFLRHTPRALHTLALAWLTVAAVSAADVPRRADPAPLGNATRAAPALPGAAVLGPLSPAQAMAAPTVRLIQPATVNAGQSQDLVFIGAGFGPRTQVSFGAGIEVLDAPQALGDSQLRVRVRVAADAAPGPRMPRMMNGALAGSGPAALTVLIAPAPGGTGLMVPGGGATGMPRLPQPTDAATRTAPLAGTPDRSAPTGRPTRPTLPQTATFPPPAFLPQPGGLPALTLPPAQIKLAFGVPVPDTTKPAWGGTERTFDKLTAATRLVWQAASPGAYQWRWQIAAQPFPADAGAPPPALLNEGDAVYDHFKLDLLPYVPDVPAPGKAPLAKPGAKAEPTAQPLLTQGDAPLVFDPQQTPPPLPTKLHIRLLALKDGQPAGVQSNTVIATYQPGAADAYGQALGKSLGDAQKAQAMAKQAEGLFALKIVDFQPAVFPDPNRLGCVKVVKNPYLGKQEAAQIGNVTTFIPHPMAHYPPGEYCPQPDPKHQQKGWFDKYVVGSIEGWALAWNKLSGYYNGAKAWVATQIADEVPCDWLGEKLEKECKGAVEQMVGAAISAGLAAAGLPPSLPDLDAVGDLGKGKIADAAVEASCQMFESNGGTCTPELRAKLKQHYKKGLDELQKQIADHLKYEAREPGCANAPGAAELSKVPLPCFSDYPGVVVEPATGSVYAPPKVKLRVTRKQPQPAHIKGCDRVSVGLSLKNTFPGGYLSGKKLPPAPLAGEAYIPAGAAVPPLGVGKSVDIPLVLAQMAVVEVPGNHHGKFYLPNWLALYLGGKGNLWASMAAANIATGLASPKEVSGACAAGDSLAVQIPQ